MPPETERTLLEAFRLFDSSNTGKMSVQQLQELVMTRGEPLPRSEFEELLLLAGLDGSKTFDYSQLVKRYSFHTHLNRYRHSCIDVHLQTERERRGMLFRQTNRERERGGVYRDLSVCLSVCMEGFQTPASRAELSTLLRETIRHTEREREKTLAFVYAVFFSS